MNTATLDEIRKDYTILFIDPGTSSTGWALGKGRDLIASGVVYLRKTSKRHGHYRAKKTIWARVADFADWFSEFLNTHPEIDAIGIEWPIGTRPQAGVKLGMILGAICIEADACGLPVYEIFAGDIKATDVHKDSPVYASQFAGREVKTDEADAIGGFLALSAKLFGLTLEQATKQWNMTLLTR